MARERSQSVGLGGDGDEIAAIEEVERTFGVTLDKADAPSWETAGDVFASLLKALPKDEAARRDVWARFADAITRETGANPARIQMDSPLLSNLRLPFWAVALGIVALWTLMILLD